MFTCFKNWRFSDSMHLIAKEATCHRQRHNTFPYSVPEQQQERNLEDICVSSAFDEFLDISFPCAMWCKLEAPDSTAKVCKNSNLKISPSELRTVGTIVVWNYFWFFCRIWFYQVNAMWWAKRWAHLHKVVYQCPMGTWPGIFWQGSE